MSGTNQTLENTPLSVKDFKSPNTVRWCPGCGDYAILTALLKAFPEMGVPKEKFVVVSGIGCSSRFPYYTNTFGFHTIHGRAPTVALGVKLAQPDSSVWMITGDGDALSIGGNHFMHLMRRNPNINIILFNNKIYGLTKGQASPTSPPGLKTKSTPFGSVDEPVNAVSLALTSGATFVARVPDTDVGMMQDVFKQAQAHQGVSLVEVFVNCVIFHDKAFDPVTNRALREDNTLLLEHGKPLTYGKEKDWGLVQEGFQVKRQKIGEDGITESDLIVHDEKSPQAMLPYMLSHLNYPDFPVPYGVFYRVSKPTYEQVLWEEENKVVAKKGPGTLESLLKSGDMWQVDGQGRSHSLTPQKN